MSVLLPHWIWKVSVWTVTTNTKYLFVLLTHWQQSALYQPDWQVYMSELLPDLQVPVSTNTTLASICLCCCHTGKNLSVLFQYTYVSVWTVTKNASFCLYKYYTNMNLPIMLPHYEVSVITVTNCTDCLILHGKVFACTDTTKQSTCQYQYHSGKYLSVLTTLGSTCTFILF